MHSFGVCRFSYATCLSSCYQVFQLIWHFKLDDKSSSVTLPHFRFSSLWKICGCLQLQRHSLWDVQRWGSISRQYLGGLWFQKKWEKARSSSQLSFISTLGHTSRDVFRDFRASKDPRVSFSSGRPTAGLPWSRYKWPAEQLCPEGRNASTKKQPWGWVVIWFRFFTCEPLSTKFWWCVISVFNLQSDYPIHTQRVAKNL